jgi:hypothetical protein
MVTHEDKNGPGSGHFPTKRSSSFIMAVADTPQPEGSK